jgi:hypothetical protein
MKHVKQMKQTISAIGVAGLLLAGSLLPAEAASGRGSGFHGRGSGWHGKAPQGGARFHGGGAKWVGGRFHGGSRWHGGTRVFIGGGLGWWGWPGWWGPGWWGAPYPYYAAPPVVVQPAPTEYIQPAPAPPAQPYWYYCQEAGAYYPYVQDCPGGWMQVVPQPVPPSQ